MILTPQIAVVISFAAGAILFFGIGLFVGRLTAKPENPRRSASTMAETAKSSVPGTLPTAASDMQQLQMQLNQALEKYQSLVVYAEGQKEKVRTSFAAVKKRIELLNIQLAESVADKRTLSNEAGLLAARLKQSELDKEALLQEKEKISHALEQSQNELEGARRSLDKLSDAQKRHQSLKHKAEKLEGLNKVVEALRDENSWLRSQLGEAEALKIEIDALKRENATLTAMGMIIEKPPSHAIASPLEGLGGSFQNIANQLSGLEGSRGVALADDLGLLIAGTGDYMEAMAGMAAVFSDVCLKIGAMLPFGDVDAMKISNRQALTIAMMPFDIASTNVVVTTLSAGSVPDRETVSRIINQATS